MWTQTRTWTRDPIFVELPDPDPQVSSYKSLSCRFVDIVITTSINGVNITRSSLMPPVMTERYDQQITIAVVIDQREIWSPDHLRCCHRSPTDRIARESLSWIKGLQRQYRLNIRKKSDKHQATLEYKYWRERCSKSFERLYSVRWWSRTLLQWYIHPKYVYICVRLSGNYPIRTGDVYY